MDLNGRRGGSPPRIELRPTLIGNESGPLDVSSAVPFPSAFAGGIAQYDALARDMLSRARRASQSPPHASLKRGTSPPTAAVQVVSPLRSSRVEVVFPPLHAAVEAERREIASAGAPGSVASWATPTHASGAASAVSRPQTHASVTSTPPVPHAPLPTPVRRGRGWSRPPRRHAGVVPATDAASGHAAPSTSASGMISPTASAMAAVATPQWRATRRQLPDAAHPTPPHAAVAYDDAPFRLSTGASVSGDDLSTPRHPRLTVSTLAFRSTSVALEAPPVPAHAHSTGSVVSAPSSLVQVAVLDDVALCAHVHASHARHVLDHINLNRGGRLYLNVSVRNLHAFVNLNVMDISGHALGRGVLQMTSTSTRKAVMTYPSSATHGVDPSADTASGEGDDDPLTRRLTALLTHLTSLAAEDGDTPSSNVSAGDGAGMPAWHSVAGAAVHALGVLPKLQRLHLACNDISSLPSLPQHMHTQLEHVPADATAREHAALVMKACGGGATGAHFMPAAISQTPLLWPNLHTLDLSHNRLHAGALDVICRLTCSTLRCLNIAGNGMKRLPTSLALFTQLEDLNINANRLRDPIVLVVCSRFPALRRLHADGNAFETVPFACVDAQHAAAMTRAAQTYDVARGDDAGVEAMLRDRYSADVVDEVAPLSHWLRRSRLRSLLCAGLLVTTQGSTSPAPGFPALESLSLCDNALSAELDARVWLCMHRLTEVRVWGNPCAQEVMESGTRARAHGHTNAELAASALADSELHGSSTATSAMNMMPPTAPRRVLRILVEAPFTERASSPRAGAAAARSTIPATLVAVDGLPHALPRSRVHLVDSPRAAQLAPLLHTGTKKLSPRASITRLYDTGDAALEDSSDDDAAASSAGARERSNERTHTLSALHIDNSAPPHNCEAGSAQEVHVPWVPGKEGAQRRQLDSTSHVRFETQATQRSLTTAELDAGFDGSVDALQGALETLTRVAAAGSDCEAASALHVLHGTGATAGDAASAMLALTQQLKSSAITLTTQSAVKLNAKRTPPRTRSVPRPSAPITASAPSMTARAQVHAQTHGVKDAAASGGLRPAPHIAHAMKRVRSNPAAATLQQANPHVEGASGTQNGDAAVNVRAPLTFFGAVFDTSQPSSGTLARRRSSIQSFRMPGHGATRAEGYASLRADMMRLVQSRVQALQALPSPVSAPQTRVRAHLLQRTETLTMDDTQEVYAIDADGVDTQVSASLEGQALRVHTRTGSGVSVGHGDVASTLAVSFQPRNAGVLPVREGAPTPVPALRIHSHSTPHQPGGTATDVDVTSDLLTAAAEVSATHERAELQAAAQGFSELMPTRPAVDRVGRARGDTRTRSLTESAPAVDIMRYSAAAAAQTLFPDGAARSPRSFAHLAPLPLRLQYRTVRHVQPAVNHASAYGRRVAEAADTDAHTAALVRAMQQRERPLDMHMEVTADDDQAASGGGSGDWRGAVHRDAGILMSQARALVVDAAAGV